MTANGTTRAVCKAKGHLTMHEFLAAVARHDDEDAERCALQLTPTDEPPLIDMAMSSDLDERWWGVRGLAQVGGKACAPTLQGRLTDEDASVRAAAAVAFSYLHVRAPGAMTDALDAVAALLADDEGLDADDLHRWSTVRRETSSSRSM